jgi:hypothetical protein
MMMEKTGRMMKKDDHAMMDDKAMMMAKEKMMADLKEKANSFKAEAEGMADKAKDYFEELRTKGSSALKDNLGDAEAMINDLFGKKNPDEKAV